MYIYQNGLVFKDTQLTDIKKFNDNKLSKRPVWYGN